MKKLNKKGFTLIELLVVLVILSIIMTIAIPNITSSLERSKEKEKNAKIELIISAAEIYMDTHKNSVKEDDGIISIQDLINDGLLTKEEIEDPTKKGYICGGLKKVNGEIIFSSTGETCEYE